MLYGNAGDPIIVVETSDDTYMFAIECNQVMLSALNQDYKYVLKNSFVNDCKWKAIFVREPLPEISL